MPRFTSLLATAFLLAGSLAAQADVENTNSSAEIDFHDSNTETSTHNTIVLELEARMQGGGLLYDQIFNVPLADPLVQAGIADAESILTGAGAGSFLGPTLINSFTSTNTVTSFGTNVSTTDYTATKTFSGSGSVFVGDWGVCQHYSLGADGYPGVSDCTGGSEVLVSLAGGLRTVIDTFDLSFVTTTVTTFISITNQNTLIYEIDGIPAVDAGVPEPAAWMLLLLGFGGLGLVLRHRRRQRLLPA